MKQKNLKIRKGILGGTFDPLHNGHISIAKAAKNDLGLDCVYLMPANCQPFKKGRKTVSKKDRVGMLQGVADENRFLKVSTIEIDENCITHTYDTITELKKQHPGEEMVFIMGIDSLMTIEDWYRGEELLKICSFAVGIRPGFDRGKTEKRISELEEKYGSRIYILDNVRFAVSSTEIKKKIKRGEDISELVPAAVERYIYEKRLYI